MTFDLTRRAAFAGAAALAACAPSAAPSSEVSAAAFPPPDHPRFAAVETQLGGGRLGVAAFDTGRNAWLTHRPRERFAMASTFKWLLAAQHLRMDQENPGWLDEEMSFGPGDLITHAPVAERHLARGYMSNETMCEAIVTVSDNTCANLLLIPAGGPAGLTVFLRAHGDETTRLDRNELGLNENAEGDPRDTTAPEAMALDLARFLTTDEVLDAAHREKLTGWFVAASTGLDRLRAGLPSGWRAGDKTGNGSDGATNDLAIFWPPGRAPIVIASYMDRGSAERPARDAAHAEIARIVVEEWT